MSELSSADPHAEPAGWELAIAATRRSRPSSLASTSAVAAAAIGRVTSRTESRNMITKHLLAHPTALVDGGSGAPGPLARLIEDLIAAALTGWRCLGVWIAVRSEAACSASAVAAGSATAAATADARWRRARSAARLAQRADSDADGQPICSALPSAHLRPAGPRCGVCGVNRTYRTKKRICRDVRSSCRTPPALACGLPAAIPTDGTAPQCSHCATGTTRPCRECGELTAGRDRKGRPRCERCYQRPVGTCGRCGRVRAIVRLAVDGDPDLCAICWTGPTATCENCGKVRPCRGERRGRMLCGTCAPVRPQTCAHCGQSAAPDGALARGAGVPRVLLTGARREGQLPRGAVSSGG